MALSPPADRVPPSAHPGLVLRPMVAGDADVVAAVHAASWRTAYRGIMGDAFLDHDALANRQHHWRERLAVASDLRAGLVAERDDRVAGFAYLIADADPERGTLLDNLHVVPASRGSGIGRRLLSAVATLIQERDWPMALHLWVFEANDGARRFYARLGAREVARTLYHAADGGTHSALCYHWDANAAAELASRDDSGANS